MSRYPRLWPATFVVAACMSLATVSSSSAQSRFSYEDEAGGWARVAHDAGYSAGLERGEADARSRRDFDYVRNPDYQRADIGYRPELTSFDRYRRVFRQGYAAGYEEGFHGYSEVRAARPPVGLSNDARRATTVDIAFEFGFADGYKAGIEDTRDRDRFQPTDHDEYENADRGYERRYGTREVYQTNYRDGFEAGYTRGYREGRR